MSAAAYEGAARLTLALGAARLTGTAEAGTIRVAVSVSANDLLLPDDIDERVADAVRASGGKLGDLEHWEVVGFDTPRKGAPNGVVRVDAVFADFVPAQTTNPEGTATCPRIQPQPKITKRPQARASNS